MGAHHELFLEWVSERAEGTWRDFRQAHDWLFPTEKLVKRQQRPGVTALVLASLGHMEMDWDHGRWCAAPPTLTVLPNAGDHALFTGGRTRTIADRLRSRLNAVNAPDVILTTRQQPDAPDAYFLPSGSESDVQTLAADLGIHYEYCVADTISRLLPSLDGVRANSSASPPAQGFEVRHLVRDGNRLRFVKAERDGGPGLFSYDVWGREEYRWSDGAGTFLRLDKFIGIYLELQRWRMNVTSLHMDGPTGTLAVPADAPLPALQARAAVLCSGLAPIFERSDGTRRYVNVPREIAERIARSLGQEIEVAEDPRSGGSTPQPHGRIQHIRFAPRGEGRGRPKRRR